MADTIAPEERPDPAIEPPGPGEAVRHATRREDGITLAITAWLIGGIFLDGYAHAYVIDTQTEDFFTPWHAIFYAAFTVLAVWIGVVGWRRQRPGPLLDWFPPGYRLSVVGLGVFAVGGVGDGIWHTVFGVEVGIDALLSPTHLILFVGGVLLLWTPVRSASARGDRSPWIAIGTTTLATAFLVFFIQYMWVVNDTWWPQQFFDADTGNGTWNVSAFLAGTVATVAVLVGPLLMIAARWRLPFGAATLVWTTAAVLESLAFSRSETDVIVCFAGGLVFDVLHRVLPEQTALPIAAAAGPAAGWSVYFVLAAADEPIRWPPEIWGGAVVLSGFVGLGLWLIQRSGSSAAARLGNEAEEPARA
ncbi:MAG: hypothetical protein AAGD35_09965 [Actinomycetota bacterium]